MTPYRLHPGQRLLLAVLVGLLVSVGVTPVAGSAKKAASAETGVPPQDAITRTAFDHYYNLDYDVAVADFERALQAHPEDPLAVNHLLSAVLYRELYRVGALDTGLYSGNSFITKKKFVFDPKVREQVGLLTEHALQIAEARLRANGDDLQALYARGLTRGLRATYIALVDKAWFSALHNAIGARRDHERVLELAPGFSDAKTIVGVHNYVAGSLPWTFKAAASLVGLSGNRQKGIKYLREAAEAGGETSVDARVALALFLRREQRFDAALSVVRELLALHPRNFLFALEEANVLKDGGHGLEAIAAYRRVLAAGLNHAYHQPHLELAAFGLGEALRGQRDYLGAAEAYESVRKYPAADADLQQRASLAAGEMYDLLLKRDLALEEYRATIAVNINSPPAETARKRLKEPYHSP